tara:strand:- start:406 stop:588 length:183 start_codon:yes stop_codon:yes gene_type:complete
MLKKKRASKEPYEGYTLPKSSEKGNPFVDWNEVLRESLGINIKKVKKIVKKRRVKRNEYE